MPVATRSGGQRDASVGVPPAGQSEDVAMQDVGDNEYEDEYEDEDTGEDEDEDAGEDEHADGDASEDEQDANPRPRKKPRKERMKMEDLPKTLQSRMKLLPGRWDEVLRRGPEATKRSHPVLTEEVLDSRLPKPADEIDEFWTQDMEDNLQAQFEADPYTAYMRSDAAAPKGGNENALAMWKSVARIRKCFPTDIIGLKMHLQYEKKVDVGGVQKPDASWTKTFCQHLSDLALGSPCGNNMRLLALLVRWAVADRIDDRRGVPLDHGTTDGFFETLSASVKRDIADKPLRQIHIDVRRALKGQDKHLPWVSDVMLAIQRENGKLPATPIWPREDEPFPVYEVRTEDLSTVLDACNNAADVGYPSLTTVQDRAAMLAQGRSKNDQIRNLAQLNALRLPLLLAERRFEEKRRLARERRLAADGGAHGVGSDQPASGDDEPDGGVFGDDGTGDNVVDGGEPDAPQKSIFDFTRSIAAPPLEAEMRVAVAPPTLGLSRAAVARVGPQRGQVDGLPVTWTMEALTISNDNIRTARSGMRTLAARPGLDVRTIVEEHYGGNVKQLQTWGDGWLTQ